MSNQRQEILDRFAAFDEDRQKSILRHGCEQAVSQWREFTGTRTIEYNQEGARLVLDTALPGKSLDEILRKLSGLPSRRAGAIAGEWDGPLLAIKDGSLDLPENITAAYQSIHLLFLWVFSLEGAPSALEILKMIIRSQPIIEDEPDSWWRAENN